MYTSLTLKFFYNRDIKHKIEIIKKALAYFFEFYEINVSNKYVPVNILYPFDFPALKVLAIRDKKKIRFKNIRILK